MNISILFNCSSLKEDIGLQKIVFQKKSDLHKSFKKWEHDLSSQLLLNKNELISIGELYKGSLWKNDIKNLLSNNQDKKLNTYVFSAGLGIRSLNDQAQPYDITFNKNNATSIGTDLESKVNWFEKLENSKVLKELFKSKNNLNKILSPQGTTFIVLSRDYMKVLIHYLEKKEYKLSSNIFFFCSKDISSNKYQSNIIYVKETMDYIYDPSLSRYKKRGYSGGIGVRLLDDVLHSVKNYKHDQITSYLESIDKSNKIIKPKRKSNISDIEIMSFIKDNIKTENISINKLHRKLRDEKLWQCEDKRFANLYKEVKNSL